MKMKWLWTSWAHIVAVCLIALELLSTGFCVTFLIPKLQKIRYDAWLVVDDYTGPRITWMFSFLRGLQWTWDRLLMGWWWLWPLLLGGLWVLFEWRVRGDNKPLIRLSILGVAGLGLLVVVLLTAYSILMPLLMCFPAVGPMVKPFALQKMAAVDESIRVLEMALEDRKDNKWDWMQEAANRASQALRGLIAAAPALPQGEQQGVLLSPEQVRAKLKDAADGLREARQAIEEKDAGRLKAAMQRFHESYDPIAKAAMAGGGNRPDLPRGVPGVAK